MDNCRLTVEFEPTNDYNKARQDVIHAIASIRKLPPEQQRMLTEELVGVASVAALLNIVYQVFGRQV